MPTGVLLLVCDYIRFLYVVTIRESLRSILCIICVSRDEGKHGVGSEKYDMCYEAEMGKDRVVGIALSQKRSGPCLGRLWSS